MGVSIHYRGKLDDKDRLPALRDALSSIASSLGWQCRVLDEDWNTPGNAILAPDDAWISLKTQFSSPEMHVFIIGLLKHIKEHHIPNLEVRDEGEYWETGDYRNLVKKMEVIDKKLDYLSRELFSDCLVDPGSLSVDEIAARIEFLLHAEEMKSRSIN